MDFGFIFKYPTSSFSLIYDGDPHKLRMVADSESAKQWINKFKVNEFVEDNIEAIGKYRISRNIIPIIKETDGVEVVNKQFSEYLIGEKVSSVLMRIWSIFLKKYDVVYDGDRVGFREKINYELGLELPDGGLMRMKEFIFGLFRFDPINIYLGKDKNGNDKFKSFDIAQHYNGKYKLGDKVLKKIPFYYKGKKYETPIYGIYAPQMRELMFGNIMDFGGGRILQKWQIDLQYNMGEETYVAAPRDSGKSFICSAIVSTFVQRTLVREKEMIDGPIVHVYGISHPSNKAIINKILKMNEKLQDGKLFKYSNSDRTMYFINNNKVAGWIEFLSDSGDEPGRGGRPTMIVIDEAAYIRRETYKITLGQSNIPKLYVSTINSDTKKNWFYEGLVRGEIMQTQYPMKQDEAIVYLWDKYGMDKYDTLESISTKEAKRKIADMREEYFSLFPLVSRRYTIDDIEYMSELEKKKKIEKYLAGGGLNEMLCNCYSEFLDEGALFQYERGRIGDDEIPDKFDMIVISFDQADEFDNPAVIVGGLKGMDIYVLESSILEGDKIEQMDRLIDITEFYKVKYGNHTPIYQIADCTQSPKSQKAYLEDRNWILDIAFRITNGGGARQTNDGFLIIGKKLLVTTTKNLFARGNIKLPDKLNKRDGLLSELEQFQAIKTTFGNIKYQAVKGKDDQVNALMFMVYFMYDFGLGDKLSENDNVIRLQNTKSKLDLIELEIEKRKMAEEEETIENSFNELMAEYGY